MGNLPKWVIFLSAFLVLVLVGVIGYFSSTAMTSATTGDVPRIVATPTPNSSPIPLGILPKVTSDSKEIKGVLEEGCVPGNLSVTSGGIKYQFKASDSIKNSLLGKEVTADISKDVVKDNCGTTVKLGLIQGRDTDQVYVLGGTVCLPAPNIVDSRDCWIGLKSQSGDYYTLDSVPNTVPTNPNIKISKLDLILVSGKLTSPTQKDFFGQKGKIDISNIELLTKDEYK